jgi:hypothetical protein
VTTPLTASPVVQALRDVALPLMVGSLDDVKVLDANDLTQIYATRSLTIGGAWDPDTGDVLVSEAISVESLESGAGRLATDRTIVSCIVYAGTGSEDFTTHRADAGAVLAAFREALRTVTDVAGASARAQITGQQWAQVLSEDGAGVIVAFDVLVEVLP